MLLMCSTSSSSLALPGMPTPGGMHLPIRNEETATELREMVAIDLSPAFGLVILTLVFSTLLHYGYMSLTIGAARRKYGVRYPTMYASSDNPNANIFNCTQRAHQNSLENFPCHATLTLLVGLKFPIVASVAAMIYILGRIVYFNNYSTGVAKARTRGAFMYIGTLTQVIAAIVMAVQCFRGKL